MKPTSATLDRSDDAPAGLDHDVFTRPGWWDLSNRDYASLRSLNGLRLGLLEKWTQRWTDGNAGSGFADRTIIDLGCGGGLMAVPMARMGARVLGVDYSFPALREAQDQRASRAGFVRGDLRRCPLRDEIADLVLLSDVLEHVADPGDAVRAATRILRPGGHLFVNTINRTRRAKWFAVTLGEGLGFIPRGTHDPARFIRPEELRDMARSHGLEFLEQVGEQVVLWRTVLQRRAVFRAGGNSSIGYCMVFRKEGV